MIQVVPNSHFWTDLDQMKNYLEDEMTPCPEGVVDCRPHEPLGPYILTGIKNTMEKGYNLTNKDDKIFVLTEKVMNGTVTMQIVTSGIRAKSFKEAIKKLKNEIIKHPIENVDETDNSLSFSIPQKENGYFEVWGRMENKPMKIF